MSPPDARRPDAGAGCAAREAGTVSFIDNAVDASTGHDQAERHVRERRPRAVAGPLRAGHAGPAAPIRRRSWCRRWPFRRRRQASSFSSSSRITRPRCATSPSSASRVTEAVIAKGLSAGEEVVTDGHLRLTPGARVSPARRGGDRAAAAGEGGAPGRGEGGRGDGAAAPEGVVVPGKARTDEHRRTIHPASRRDDAARHDHPDLRHHGLPAAAGQRPPDDRLPHDSSQRQSPRSQP